VTPNVENGKRESYNLLVSEKNGPFKIVKKNITLQEALTESANYGYKNLLIDIMNK
jgi:hypothetical protein